MLDGVKLTPVGLNPSVWEENPLLNFVSRFSHTTNEIEQRKRAKFQSLEFAISECETCTINGSLHKYYNANNTNSNDLTFLNLLETINNLKLNFSIDPNTTLIRNLEIGVNIPLNYDPDIVIQSLISHKKRSFYPMDRDNEKIGFECSHDRYRIKIYNKSLQSKLQNNNLLRYEIKIKKTAKY